MRTEGAPRDDVGAGLYRMASLTRLYAMLLILPLTHGLPTRTERLSAQDPYYMNGNIRCLQCSPGEFVKTACTITDSRGVCAPCPHGTYSEHPTGMNQCIRCTRCRDDQEEVSSCSSTKNALCRCKEGTFCFPDQSCEVCTRCTPSCPEGQVIKARCNSTSDIQCAPPSNSNHTRDILLSVGVVLVLLVIIIILGFLVIKKRKAGTGPRLIRKLTLPFCKPKGDGDTGTQLLPRGVLEMKEGTSEDERDEIFSKSCVIFADKVPPKQFEKFMLKLGLGVNAIERAKMDHRDNVEAQNHAMLWLCYQEKNFDVNLLLETLHSLKMGKAADDITDQLIRDGLYIRRTIS